VRLWSLDLSLVSKHDQNKPSCHVLQGHKSNVKAVSFSCQGLLVGGAQMIQLYRIGAFLQYKRL
jgi:hypothetical protein